METYLIYIPHNVPSLKTGKVPVSLPGKKHTTLVPAPEVRKYLQKIGVKKYSGRKKKVEGYKTRINVFKQAFKDINFKPEKYVGFHFVRDSKRKFDFHNAVQVIADLMVAHDIIEDDNMDYFVPYCMQIDGNDYSIDKGRGGVHIKLRKA